MDCSYNSYESNRQETALSVFPYNIFLRDEIFLFLYHFYIKKSWYIIVQICIKMVEVISRNLKKYVSPRWNFPIIDLNTWVTGPDGDLNS